MKTAITLSGGGARGSYEAGLIKALHEIGITFDIVTGTSVGALNGALMVQGDVERLISLWENMGLNDVFEGQLPAKLSMGDYIKESNLVLSFFKSYVKEKGADITPFKKILHDFYNEEKFFASPIDFGLVTVRFPSLHPLFVTKEMMRNEMGEHYLLASASCFPAFPLCEFPDGTTYIDGGYYDNLPINFALQLGAQRVIAVELESSPQHPHFLNRPNITYINPSYPVGNMFNFTRESIDRNMKIGYFDGMKTFGRKSGMKYTFKLVQDKKDLFNAYYLKLLQLEHFLRQNRLLVDQNSITNRLCRDNNLVMLTSEQTNFAIIDAIMIALKKEMDVEYCLDEVIEHIKETFSEAMDESYDCFPDLQMVDVLKFLQSLDKVRILKILLHLGMYPKKKVPFAKIFHGAFALEMAMALWIGFVLGQDIDFMVEDSNEEGS